MRRPLQLHSHHTPSKLCTQLPKTYALVPLHASDYCPHHRNLRKLTIPHLVDCREPLWPLQPAPSTQQSIIMQAGAFRLERNATINKIKGNAGRMGKKNATPWCNCCGRCWMKKNTTTNRNNNNNDLNECGGRGGGGVFSSNNKTNHPKSR